MRKLTLALSTAALALPGAAVAQSPAAPARGAKPDMTRAQAQAKAEAAFARMDADNSGIIDQADRAARQAAAFDRMDANKDGAISRAEFDASRAEGGYAGGGQRMGARHGMMRGGKGGQRMGASATPLTRQAFVDRSLAMFDRADANRDGTVTQAERKAVRDTMRQQWMAERAARQQG